MEKINVSKALTSQPQVPTAVPSLSGTVDKVAFKSVPNLNHFLKTPSTTDLKSRKSGIYTLKRLELKGTEKTVRVDLIYKLGKTVYKIKSCTKVTPKKGSPKTTEGEIIIVKGIFKHRKFKLKDLPKNVQDSINENIIKFNDEYSKQLVEQVNKDIINKHNKKEEFFEGLDL